MSNRRVFFGKSNKPHCTTWNITQLEGLRSPVFRNGGLHGGGPRLRCRHAVVQPHVLAQNRVSENVRWGGDKKRVDTAKKSIPTPSLCCCCTSSPNSSHTCCMCEAGVDSLASVFLSIVLFFSCFLDRLLCCSLLLGGFGVFFCILYEKHM